MSVMARPILFSGPMIRALFAGNKTQTRRIVKPRWGLPAIQNLHDTDPHLFSGRHADPESWGWPFADDGAPMSLACWKDLLCPYGKAGDLLWVRETFARHPQFADLAYQADDDGEGFEDSDGFLWEPKYSPSIHMPRSISRLTLRVTEVRVQRLQEISEADAIAEGATSKPDDGPFAGTRPPIWSMNWPDQKPVEGWHYVSLGSARYAFGNFINELHGGPRWNCTRENLRRDDPRGLFEENPWVWALSFEVIKANVDQVLAQAA